MTSSELPLRSNRLPRPAYQPAPHWIAVCAAVFTLPLLYVGGTVTTYHVGLAVPDWPTTFGENMFSYDFGNAPFGVRIEHTHRLYGAAVGLATVLLCLWLLAFDPRRWLKGLGILALGAVVVQGVLGGTRVTQISTLLAAIHGIVGQAFFGLMAALCVFTGRKWYAEEMTADRAPHYRTLTALILSLIVVQIVLGSWSRHFGSLLSIVAHSLIAAAIWISGVIVLFGVERNRGDLLPMVAAARTLFALTTLQILLGAIALFGLLPLDGTPRPTTASQAIVRTSHQTDGALILAASVVLRLRAYRHLSPRSGREDAGSTNVIGSVRRPAAGGLDWEPIT
jgi:cytochrome c oxidase assembly protein subunit 15